MKRVAVTYRRVSTVRQAEKGQSLAAQREQVARYCELRGFAVIKHAEDRGKSGRSREGRPGLREAIDLACERKGVLVCYSLSRLSRSIIDASAILRELRGAGADLAIVDCQIDTSTAAGELIFNVMMSIAQFQSQLIGEQIKYRNGVTVATKGYRTNGEQPAGCRIENGVRVPVESERRVVDKVRELAAGKSLREAATAAEAAGLTTIRELRGRGKSPWTPSMVRRILAKS